jgi:hypothetical protein
MNRLKIAAIPIVKQSSASVTKSAKPVYAYILVSNAPQPCNEGTSAFQKRLAGWKEEGMEAFETWRHLPDDNIKRKIIIFMEKVKDMIDPYQTFASDMLESLDALQDPAGEIGKPAIEIIYPSTSSSSFDVKEMKEDLGKMISSTKTSVHHSMVFYTVITPFTAAAAILPGPNIFFAANALRLYALWRSHKALGMFNAIMDNTKDNKNNVDFIISASEDEHLNWNTNMYMINDEKKESEILSDEKAQEICFSLGIVDDRNLEDSIGTIHNYINAWKNSKKNSFFWKFL